MEQAWLVIDHHDRTRDFVRLSLALTTVGRSDQNVIEVLDPKLSRFHFEIERRGDRYVLRDCNSRNGTMVNGEPSRGASRPLSEGDRIKAGRTLFTFSEERPEELRTDGVRELPPMEPSASAAAAISEDLSEETTLEPPGEDPYASVDDDTRTARRRPTARGYDRRNTETIKASHAADPWRFVADASLRILDATNRTALLERAVEQARPFYQAAGGLLALGQDPDDLTPTAVQGISGEDVDRCMEIARRVLVSRGLQLDDRRALGIPIRTGSGGLEGALVLFDLAAAAREDAREVEALQVLADLLGRALTSNLLLEEVRREERAAGARRIAQDLRSFLRSQEPEPVPGLAVGVATIPSEDVGLDVFDQVPGPERAGRREVYFAIGDVPDDEAPPVRRLRRRGERGFVSLLGQAEVRGALRTMLETIPRTSDLLAQLHAALGRQCSVERLSLTLARFDTSTGALRFAGAGHQPVLVRRADGSIEQFEAQSGPLGLEPPKVAERDLRLERDDQALFVTSAIQRLPRNAAGRREDLGELFARLGGVAHPAEEVARRLVTALLQYAVGEERESMTLVVLRRT